MAVLTSASANGPPAAAQTDSLADLMARLGHVPLNRVRIHPPPGTASEKDVIESGKHGSLCELVDGVLVEKAMGIRESLLACFLIELIGPFVRERNLGLVTGEQGAMRLLPGLVRIPDVAFISWAHTTDGRVPGEPIPAIVPDLAVEVLSENNTPEEMVRKRQEYFAAGVRLVWLVNSRARIVDVYTGEDQVTQLTQADTLDGGSVLPGFRLPLKDWFGELDRQK